MTCPSLSVPRKAALTVTLLLASAGIAHTEPWWPAPAGPPAIVKRLPPCHSRAGCDRRDHDYSGTRGRMGLGADPAHPEGPGNAPN